MREEAGEETGEETGEEAGEEAGEELERMRKLERMRRLERMRSHGCEREASEDESEEKVNRMKLIYKKKRH